MHFFWVRGIGMCALTPSWGDRKINSTLQQLILVPSEKKVKIQNIVFGFGLLLVVLQLGNRTTATYLEVEIQLTAKYVQNIRFCLHKKKTTNNFNVFVSPRFIVLHLLANL